MSRISWRDRVTIDPELHHGDACIRGTRIPVRTLIGSLADGMTPAEIVAAYPQLTEDDVRGALSYAAEILRHDLMMPLSSAAISDAHQGR